MFVMNSATSLKIILVFIITITTFTSTRTETLEAVLNLQILLHPPRTCGDFRWTPLHLAASASLGQPLLLRSSTQAFLKYPMHTQNCASRENMVPVSASSGR